jgi:signal transduction histidine kinase
MVLSLDSGAISDKFMENYHLLVERLRQTINGLRPPMLAFGLYAALSEMHESLCDLPNSRIKYVLDIPKTDSRFDINVELHIYRIIQQAVENAQKHANSSCISLSGSINPEGIDISIIDNGIGIAEFNDFDFVGVLKNNHFGLAGMYERASLIKAQLLINSSSSNGTNIHITWNAKPL